MPLPIRQDDIILRLLKDVNDIRSALRRVVANLPLYDISNENTPTQITANQNDYVPGNYDVLRLSSNAARTITGFRGGVKGRFLRIFNVGNYEITIAHQSASSAVGNRVQCPTGFDIVINTGGQLVLYYDLTLGYWISSYASNADRITGEFRITAAQSIANATYDTIHWTSVIKDTGNFTYAPDDRFLYISQTGWYQLTLHICFDVNGVGFRESYIVKESPPAFLTENVCLDSRTGVTGGSTNVDLTRQMWLNAGDFVTSLVWQNSGGPLNINVSGPLSSYTTLIIEKM